jgi:hypothetical protein
MNIYTITFVDGMRIKINAKTSDEAIRNAQETHRKAAASFSNEQSVEEQPSSPFESMQHGGPNP